MSSMNVGCPTTRATGRFRRKGYAIALVASGLLLAACGSPSKAVEGAASRKPSAAPVTINFLNVGADPQVLSYFNNTVIPDFEKAHPDIRISMETTDWGSAFTKITTAVASRSAPDVFIQGGIWLGSLEAAHALLPLNKYLSKWSGRSDIPAATMDTGQIDGTQYAIPYYSDLRGLWYNKADLAAAHISPPTTLNELAADAKKLTVTKNGSVEREGMDWAIDNSIGLQQAYTELLYSMGGHEFNAARTASDLTSATALSALKYMESFYKDGASSTKFVDVGSAPQPIAIGKAAMEENGFGVYQSAKTYDPSVLSQLAFEAFPTPTGSNPVALSFPTKLSIYAGTKHPAQAWTWMSYILQPKIQSKWDALGGALPTDTNANLGPAWSTPLARSFFKLASISKAQPTIPVMLKLGPMVNTDLQEAISGQESAKAALSSAASSIDAMMKQG